MMPTQVAHELCSLAAQNDVSQLEAWVKAGADVNAHDFDYQRPLYSAVEWNRLESVDILLRHGANPDALGPTDESPLSLANRRPDVLMQIREMLHRVAEARRAATNAYSAVVHNLSQTVANSPLPPSQSSD